MIRSPSPAKGDSQPFHRFTVDEYDKMVELGILTENHPVVLIRGEVVDRATWQSRYRFPPHEYKQMIAHGIISPSDRIELGQGEVFADLSVSALHVSCNICMNRHFSNVLGDNFLVSCHNPIRLADSEPEPDISLLKFREDFYRSGHPRLADVLLVVEAADASLHVDRTLKLSIYAESGVFEYWIVNLIDDCLEVYRSPQPDGTYADKQTLRRGQHVEIQALPGFVFEVADLL